MNHLTFRLNSVNLKRKPSFLRDKKGANQRKKAGFELRIMLATVFTDIYSSITVIRTYYTICNISWVLKAMFLWLNLFIGRDLIDWGQNINLAWYQQLPFLQITLANNILDIPHFICFLILSWLISDSNSFWQYWSGSVYCRYYLLISVNSPLFPYGACSYNKK